MSSHFCSLKLILDLDMIPEVTPDDVALYEYVMVDDEGTSEFTDMVFLAIGFGKALGPGLTYSARYHPLAAQGSSPTNVACM
jgi:hypothetical protein